MVRWFPVMSLMLGAAIRVVASEYYGKKVGPLETLQHGVAGNVFAATEFAVIISEFTYDGRGPDAHFWADIKGELYATGDQLPDESGGTKVLGSFKKDIVYVELLKSITTYKSFGVFCKKFEADFGHVQIPTGYKPPVEESLGPLASKQPNTMASDVILKTSASATLKEFEYDGSCPNAAFFVAAPSISAKPEEMVHLLYGPNKTTPLQRVNKVDVDIFLPEGHNWNDFVSLAVYCVQKKVVLADVAIDKTLAESVPLHNPKAYIKKANITGKGDASTPGPVSALSLFSSSMAALVAVIAIRNCFDNGDPVES